MKRARLKLYEFTYAEEGVLYDPVNPSFRVRARNLREARVKARRKLAAILRHQGRAYWEWHSDRPGWQRVPRREVKGHLIGDGRLVHWPAMARRLWRERVERAKQTPIVWPRVKGFDGSREAFAQFVAAPIQEIIDRAPAIADLFKGGAHEATGFSIPIVHTSYSRSRPTEPPVILSHS